MPDGIKYPEFWTINVMGHTAYRNKCYAEAKNNPLITGLDKYKNKYTP